MSQAPKRRLMIVVRTQRRQRGRRPKPELSSRRRAARIALAPTAWLAWRMARSGYWSQELQARTGAHSRYWEQLAGRRGDLLYVAIGDSTAQGIGAREPAGSYVGQLERMLGVRVQVVNLSISGARLSDIVTALLPRLARVDSTHALVTFAAGANDIDDFDPVRFRSQLATIFDALPRHALIAEIPSFYISRYQPVVREANAILHELADARDLAVIPLHGATNRFGVAAIATHHAADLFHPNDRGYRVWAKAFLGPAAARVDELTRLSREAQSASD